MEWSYIYDHITNPVKLLKSVTFCFCTLLCHVYCLQIQHKDAGDIVLLAPPSLWRWWKCFAVAELIATQSKGACPVVNGKGTRAEEDDLVYTTFLPILMTNYVVCCCDCAPSPMAAAEALCTGGTCHRSIKVVKARGEWKEYR